MKEGIVISTAAIKRKDPRRVVRLLQLITLMRSMGQGAALTITTLYLRELGWSGAAIGGVLVGSGLVRAVLSIVAPELNALLGAKRYLLFYEALTLAASFIAAIATAPWLLAVAMIAAGFGSGHSGSGGPTAPIERAWLGAYARDKNKAKALYGRNAVYSYAGLGAGALLACIPMLACGTSESVGSFRLLYAFIMILTLACLFCILCIQGGARRPRGLRRREEQLAPAVEIADNERPITQTEKSINSPSASNSENSVLTANTVLTADTDLAANTANTANAAPPSPPAQSPRQNNLRMLASMLSGAAAILTSTVTSYWFLAKFGVSPGKIGAVMAASYFGAALLSRLTGGTADRRGTLKAIASLQLASILLLLALPWVSSFRGAALLEIACTACCLGSRGNRTNVQMEDRDRRARGSLLSRIYRVVVRLTFILWPGAFVYFIDQGDYVTPFYFAAGIQAVTALLFRRAFLTRSA